MEKELGVKKQSIAKLVENVGKVYDRRDQVVEQLRLMQQTSEHSQQSSVQDVMEVEDVPSEASTCVDMKLTDYEKMKKAMGKNLPAA